jgi:hypothetical protein
LSGELAAPTHCAASVKPSEADRLRFFRLPLSKRATINRHCIASCRALFEEQNPTSTYVQVFARAAISSIMR